MKFLSVPLRAHERVTFAFWPTRMDTGVWVWLEPYKYHYWTRMMPGCPTFKIKEEV